MEGVLHGMDVLPSDPTLGSATRLLSGQGLGDCHFSVPSGLNAVIRLPAVQIVPSAPALMGLRPPVPVATDSRSPSGVRA